MVLSERAGRLSRQVHLSRVGSAPDVGGWRRGKRSPRRRPSISPQSVVLAVLVTGFAWALVFPLRLTRPPSMPLLAAYLAGLAAVAVALFVVLRSAVDPGRWPRATTVGPGLLVLACLGVWLPTYSWAEPGQQPWPWLAGFAIGANTLVDRRAGSVAALVVGAAAAAGAVAFGRSAVAGVPSGVALAPPARPRGHRHAPHREVDRSPRRR